MRLLRLGELTPVRVPEELEEATRDLVRAREDVRTDLMRARHRLSKLLLRHGLVWPGSAWTRAYERWLRGLRFPARPLAVAFDESYGAVLQAKARRDALDAAIAEAAAAQPFAATVARLCCLRGVSTLTALALAVELGDWHRFQPGSLGAFLGLVPSEASSGQRRRQGAITKTGNSHARRLLVEAAWHQRRPLRPSLALAGGAPASPPPSAPRRRRAHGARTNAGRTANGAAGAARSSPSPSRASSPATASVWRLWTEPSPRGEGEESAPARHARSNPRPYYQQPDWAKLDPRERHRSRSHSRSCGPDPRIYQSDRRVDDSRPPLPAQRRRPANREPSSPAT